MKKRKGKRKEHTVDKTNPKNGAEILCALSSMYLLLTHSKTPDSSTWIIFNRLRLFELEY